MKKEKINILALPTLSMLDKSIKNNYLFIPFFNFIWGGFMVLYVILKQTEWLLMAILVFVFVTHYTLIYKIDKSRRELLLYVDEIKLRIKGDKNV